MAERTVFHREERTSLSSRSEGNEVLGISEFIRFWPGGLFIDFHPVETPLLLFLESKAFIEEPGIVIADYENVHPSPVAPGDDAVEERRSYAATANER